MKFFKSVLTAMCLLAGASLFAEEAQIPEEKGYDFPKPSFNLNVKWATGYICDGFILNPDPVTSLDFSMSLGNLYMGVWAQYDWTGFNDREMGFNNSRKNTFEELDYYIGYAYTIDDGAGFADLTIEGVFTYMDYPQTKDGYDAFGNERIWNPNHNKELSLIFSLGNMLDKEDQSLTAATRFDYDTVTGRFYGQIDGNYTKALCEKTELELSSSMFWGAPRKMRAQAGEQAHGNMGWGIRSIVFEAAVNYAMTEDITITPYVGASYLPNVSVRKNTRKGNDHINSLTWAGVKANYAF